MRGSLQDYEDQRKKARITIWRAPKGGQRRTRESVSLTFWMS